MISETYLDLIFFTKKTQETIILATCAFSSQILPLSFHAQPTRQLPNVLAMTEERKLSNTNKIKLSGNLIGLLRGDAAAILLWGDNESHHSLLGWEETGAAVETQCICVFETL